MDRNRTTYHPAFYRVLVTTVKGRMWRDCRTLAEARQVARRDRGSILACWYVEGSRALDTEPVT